MKLYVRHESVLELEPTTTVSDIKNYIVNNGYDLNTAVLTFSNNRTLSPVVFQTNDYDNITLEAHKDHLKGSVLYLEKVKYKEHQLEFPPPTDDNPYMFHQVSISTYGVQPHLLNKYLYFKSFQDISQDIYHYATKMRKRPNVYWYVGEARIGEYMIAAFVIGFDDKSDCKYDCKYLGEKRVYYLVSDEEADLIDDNVDKILEGITNHG